ncbi:Flp/Fap pilin component (fragment) [Thiocapsa sp. KS1]
MIAILKKFWMDEEGGEAVEWPLVVALIVIGLVVLWQGLGTAIGNVLQAIIDELTDALA